MSALGPVKTLVLGCASQGHQGFKGFAFQLKRWISLACSLIRRCRYGMHAPLLVTVALLTKQWHC